MQNDDFEREKLAFGHNTAQMRALNEQMNKVPTIAVTLTGGLWFAASQAPVQDVSIRFGLMMFAGFANLGLILACYRVRDVLESYLERIKEFAPLHFADGKPKQPFLGKMSNYSMITVYTCLMATAAAMSFIGGFTFYWPFPVTSRWVGWVVLIAVLAVFYCWLFKKKNV